MREVVDAGAVIRTGRGRKGSPYVYGVLEDHYEKGMSVTDRMDLAIRALHAAMRRDSASGDGYNVASITKEGFVVLDEKDVQKRLAKMKLT